MINRIILAAVLAAGTAGTTLADVKVNTPGARVETPSGPVDLNLSVGSPLKPTEAWSAAPSTRAMARASARWPPLPTTAYTSIWAASLASANRACC